jgi:hypothetical protein
VIFIEDDKLNEWTIRKIGLNQFKSEQPVDRLDSVSIVQSRKTKHSDVDSILKESVCWSSSGKCAFSLVIR